MTRDVLKRVAVDLRTTGDDQISLNRILGQYDIDWRIEPADRYTLSFRGTRFVCSRSVIEGRSSKDDLAISLLPHHLFQRLPVPTEAPYVKHLVSDKTMTSKLEQFQQANCLFLAPEWREIEFVESTINRVAIR